MAHGTNIYGERSMRNAAWRPGEKKYQHAYGKIFSQHVSLADKGCDFDFLEGTAPTPEREIHQVISTQMTRRNAKKDNRVGTTRWPGPVMLVCGLTLFGSGALAASSEDVVLPDANIHIVRSGVADEPKQDVVRSWITDAATAVRTYYGRFPVQRLRILVQPHEGRGAITGTTYAYHIATIRVGVGRDSSHADLTNDWIMTHEMVHLAMPRFPDRQSWLEEGLATYVEPIARAQAGLLSEEKVWGDMFDDMRKGLPLADDRGLDNTPTWGRTYWGGAMFYLLADVQIRERTANRLGLQDALRAIVAAGGSHLAAWDVDRTLAIGDRATGTTVLSDLYREMRDAPVSPNLEDLWRRLGVDRHEGRVVFDDSAALAEIRLAITRRPES